MLEPVLKKNDRLAHILIGIVSAVVFIAVVALKNIELGRELSFDVHVFAKINAVINSSVAFLLFGALMAVQMKKYELHKRLMFVSIVLSILFLLTYIAHHALAGETHYPQDAPFRIIYLVILITHIVLAAVILPFILYTSYRALTGEYARHKKIARITWPVWFYVAVSGVIVHIMISPYY
jgi:putative membrane protein